MPAFIDGRQLGNGEFVCVIEGVTYVGRAQGFNYEQSAAGWLPTCTVNGVITSQQREEPPAPVELTYQHLTVTYVSYEDLPVEGAHNRLYLIFQDNVLLPCAYVYRPEIRRPTDTHCTLPYKPTNLSAVQVRAAYPDGSLLPRWHTADIASHVCHRVAGDTPTWSTGLLLSNERVFADPALHCDITGETLAAPVHPTVAPAGPRGRLTVQILPRDQLPFAGDRDTLYVVTTATLPSGRLFDAAAYVYRPADPGDDLPYKATNVSAAIVARLHDSGDLLPSQADIARDSLAVPVRYVIAERPNAQLEVRTRDDFLAWMPLGWILNEIPVRSRPGHVVSPEVRTVLARWAVDEIDEVTRREMLQAGSITRNTVPAAWRTTIPDRPLPGPVVTYVSCLDELPVQGEEHRLYCIHGYEAAYVYRRGHTPPYRPTNLSAAVLAEHYPSGWTLPRVPSAHPLSVVVTFNSTSGEWRHVRTRDDQGEYCCSGRYLLDIEARGEPLEGRRDNTAAHAFTLPPGTAIPTRAVQGDSVVVPIPPNLSIEQIAEARGVVLPPGFNTTRAATASSSWTLPPSSERPSPPLPAQPKFDPLTAFDRQIPRRLLLDD